MCQQTAIWNGNLYAHIATVSEMRAGALSDEQINLWRWRPTHGRISLSSNVVSEKWRVTFIRFVVFFSVIMFLILSLLLLLLTSLTRTDADNQQKTTTTNWWQWTLCMHVFVRCRCFWGVAHWFHSFYLSDVLHVARFHLLCFLSLHCCHHNVTNTRKLKMETKRRKTGIKMFLTNRFQYCITLLNDMVQFVYNNRIYIWGMSGTMGSYYMNDVKHVDTWSM